MGLVIAQAIPMASARDPHVYDNLMRSRDALLAQKTYLQKANDDLVSQINDLQDKQKRVSDYLKQVDQSLRDVDFALQRAS